MLCYNKFVVYEFSREVITLNKIFFLVQKKTSKTHIHKSTAPRMNFWNVYKKYTLMVSKMWRSRTSKILFQILVEWEKKNMKSVRNMGSNFNSSKERCVINVRRLLFLYFLWQQNVVYCSAGNYKFSLLLPSSDIL